MKKTPLTSRRRKAILSGILVFSIFFIAYGVYSLQKMKPVDGKKEEVKIETGDRPLKKNEVVYINAESGLSLRQDRDQNSKRLVVIPNKTKLEATEEIDGWYKVSYEGKDGWILKQYTTSDAPAEDPYKEWTTFTASAYKVKYPLGWKVKEYGENTSRKSSLLVAFSNQELPSTVPSGSEFIAPITFDLSTQTIEEVSKGLDSISGVTKETIGVGGKTATKYIYTSTYSNTQMTTILLSANGKVLVLNEAGGYQDDLLNMIKTMSF